MTPTPLSENQLETICGGNKGTYMSELSEFVHTKPQGTCFCFKFANSDDIWPTATSDAKFALIVRDAATKGDVTFISPSGKKQTFTAAQLQAMFQD